MNPDIQSTPQVAGIKALTEAKIKRLFATQLILPKQGEPQLTSALKHILDHPGSLVRAHLCYWMSRAYHLEEKNACALAIAVEYFHTASLLFDDLPCMDNATTRRNTTCCHILFGEATTILAALSLINRAYALAWEVLDDLPRPHRQLATRYLEDCLGLAGLANGQSRDLVYGREAPSAARVLKVAMGKTVPLIRLALVWPALVADASHGEILLWKRLAVWWGLSYQVLDDIKDIYAGAAKTGKTGHRDSLLDHPNLALVEGGATSIHRVFRMMRLSDEGLQTLAHGSGAWGFLHGLRNKLAGELNQCLNMIPDSRLLLHPML